MLSVVMLNDVMLSVVMLNDVMLNEVMLSVFVLNDVILSVIMLNVVAPLQLIHFRLFHFWFSSRNFHSRMTLDADIEGKVGKSAKASFIKTFRVKTQ
jgi:hypothetical protein